MMVTWNPWHGCTKYSEGCLNCYVDRIDKYYGNSSEFKLNQAFKLPLSLNTLHHYKYSSGTIFFTCFTSDFFLDKADEYRNDVWEIIKLRSDCIFFIVTKRVDMIYDRLPKDWGDGYKNVVIACTIENQKQADYRLPIFLNLPIKFKHLCIEPLLEFIDIEKYLSTGLISNIICGGESGYGDTIRQCHESWVLHLYSQAKKFYIPFCFKQTGTYFVPLFEPQINVYRAIQCSKAREYGYQDYRIDDLERILKFEVGMG